MKTLILFFIALALGVCLPASGIPSAQPNIILVPELRGKKGQQEHEFILWDFAGYGGQLAVRMGDWKGVKQNVKKNPDTPLELYNLKSDPFESTNVAAQHPELVQQIEAILSRERVRPAIEKFRFGKYTNEE